MENRNPHLNFKLVPVGGIDRSISCALCPSACCRKDMSLILSAAEAYTLRRAGTVLERVKRGLGGSTYRLLTDCGNLLVGPDGSTSCAVYNTLDYPKTCGRFPMGGYKCVDVQDIRVVRGEDTHEPGGAKNEAVL